MRTILWATLTANGSYAQASADHPPKREALEDFVTQARRTGNFIVGRRTFEGFQADASRKTDDADEKLAGVEPIVVSTRMPPIPGITCVASPADALAHVERRGFRTALVAGGGTLLNAFLEHDLVDEIVINVAPALDDDGVHLALPQHQYAELKLLELRDLGGGVSQLRYALQGRQE
jgi:dihydrofolate reductase